MATIEYVRGTTYNITFNYFPSDGMPAGQTALFTVKNAIDNDATDLQSSILTPKNIPLVSNSCVITIAPGDVGMTHDPGKNYIWDIKVIDASDEIYPAASGKFKLDVTATNRITG